MSNRLKDPLISLSSQSIGYGLGVFGRQIILYLTLPLFTNNLERDEFGIISVMLAFLSFIDMLSNAGLPAATFRLYNDTENPNRRAQLIGTSLFLFISYSIFMAVAVWMMAGKLSSILLGDNQFSDIFRIVSVILLVSTLNTFGYILLRINVRPLASSFQNLFQVLAQLCLSLMFVIALRLGARGYLFGQLGGAVIGLLTMIWLVRRYITFKISKRRFWELTHYALPIIPSALSLWALRLVDRALVASLAGLNEVAVYEVGYRIGSITAMVTAPFLAAWPQFAFSNMYRSNASKIYRDVLTYVATGCTFTAVVIIVFSPELVSIMAPPEYSDSINIIPWIVLSQIAWGIYPILSLGPKITKRTSHLAWVTGLAAIINILLNLLLIPTLGIKGAAIATLVAYLVLAVTIRVIGQRLYQFPIDWIRLGKIALVGLMVVILAFQSKHIEASIIGGAVLRAGILLLFPILLILLGFVGKEQIYEVILVIYKRTQIEVKRILKLSEIT
jgi:O-antigen/teichoic acid export membrane protein